MSEKITDEKFWLVCSPTGQKSPSYRHAMYAQAAAEAERLAMAHPGQTFFVLGAEMSCCAVSMQRVEYVDRVPF
jgi:hypothetical protein